MLLMALLLCTQLNPPEISTPFMATFQGGRLEIRGHDFGSPGAAQFLYLRSGSHQIQMPSTDPAVTSWTDTRLEIQLPPDLPSGQVRVVTAAGWSRAIEVTVYAYQSYDIPITPGTNALPLSLEVDEQSRVWINQEFHREFQLYDPAVGQVQGLAIPKPPDPGPFANTIFSDHRTQTSALGEDVMIDPMGRVWFTQGGGYLYSGVHPNHSRIVCVLPDAAGGPEFRVYNVPGDKNEVIGLCWDPTRQWVWFAMGGLEAGARIIGFDPEKIAWDNHFDFSTSLMDQVCTPGLPDDPCFHVYEVPNPTSQPAHLLSTADGKIWFTSYWGRGLDRLDPATGEFTHYPVPDSISKALPSYVVGAGPWEIVEAPNGDIVFNEFFDATITRFDINCADDPACQKLDGNGLNPGMQDWVIPYFDPRKEQMHSIAYDLEGNLWYTIHTANEPGLGGSVGYLTADGRHMTRFPPLSDMPGPAAGMADGISVDPRTGDIWFTEFYSKRIGRLRKIPSKN
jgi:streptogramin lyase